MELTLDLTVSPLGLTFAGAMTMYSAAELQDRMIGLVEDYSAVALDLAEIEEIESPALQLLLLAHRQATAASRAFALATISGPVRGVLDLFDVTRHLGAPVEPA